MSIEDNKELVRQFWGCLGSGDFEKMGSLYHADVTYHGLVAMSGAAARQWSIFARGYKVGFPDMQSENRATRCRGRLCSLSCADLRHKHRRVNGMPPTGKAVNLRWVMNVAKIDRGQIVEEWEVFDQADFMRQLGLGS